MYSSVQTQWDVNLVRLYLQVITLSDMSDASGQCIKECYLTGVRDIKQQRERINWPRQEHPTKHQINQWTKYIRTHFVRHGNKWTQALGPIKPNTWEDYSEYIRAVNDPAKLPIHYDSHRQYIPSLPTWYKRLLAKYSQKASDHRIWKSFQSKGHQIDIISDGGLAEQFGTFGWKIVTAGDDTLLYE